MAAKSLGYVDLHAHSTHSYLDGCNLPADIAKRVAAVGRGSHALTDHGNVSSHVDWEIAALAEGIKPIFGLEMYFTPSVAADKANKRRINTHMTVLAQDERGYRNLLGMVTESFRDGMYYRALVDEANVRRHKDGLIFLSGCLNSMLSKRILADEGDLNKARRLAEYWRDMVGADNYFLETQMFSLDKSRLVNEAVMRLHLETGIPMVMTNDVHMLDGTQDQRDNRRLLHCIRDRRAWDEDPDEFSYADEYILADDEIRPHAEAAGLVGWYKQMIATGAEIAERCNVTLPKSSFIEFPLPEGVDKREYFYKLVIEGARYRGIDLKGKPEYYERAKYECRLIEDKGYIDYFLVIADMVIWAKENGIFVGPARGSAAGSLVAWLLRITEVDPMEFGLMFERFIDVTRTDLPDIDLDFDKEERWRVKEYMEGKYGKERVAILGTFMEWKGKGSLDAVGKAFHIPPFEVKKVKDLMIERSSADARAGFTIEDTFEQWPKAKEVAQAYPDIKRAVLLETQMRGWSTHACGLLVSSRPFDEVCAQYYHPDSDEGVASVEYAGAQHLGLLKIDILGIKALTIIREVCDGVGITLQQLYNLPLDDEATFEGFREQDVMGIFQFEGGAMRSLLAQFGGISTFIELSHINALSRPGPLHGGMTTAFINARNGVTEPTRLHPSVDALLSYTYGHVVYQEQILGIAQQVGRLSWEDCNGLRKAMSKKYGREYFDRMRVDFHKGATEGSGLDAETAEKVWNSMITFGSWAFNLSHSVSYAILGYWMMYMKRHYPTEFYAALIKHEENEELVRMYLIEWQKKGGTILQPQYNRSGVYWKPEGHMRIRAGLSAIKGIGEKVAERIVSGQPYASPDDLAKRRSPAPSAKNPSRTALVANKAQVTALESAGAFDDEDDTTNDFLGVQALVDSINSLHAQRKIGGITHEEDGPVQVAGMLKLRNLRSLKEMQSVKVMHINDQGEAVLEERKEVKRPDLDEFLSIHVEDDTGIIIASVNRFIYPRYRSMFWDKLSLGDIIVVEGYTSEGYRNIRVEDVMPAYKRVGNKYVPFDEIEEMSDAS